MWRHLAAKFSNQSIELPQLVGGRYYDFNSYLQPFGRNCHIPAKKVKNRPKIEKNSNLKVDALPYSSTDSTRFYREYYLGIPLSIAGIKNYFGWTAKKWHQF